MNKIPFSTTVFWTVAKISSSRNCDNKNCLEFFGSRIATERGKIIAPSLTKSDFNLLYTFLNLLCCKTRKKSSNIFLKVMNSQIKCFENQMFGWNYIQKLERKLVLILAMQKMFIHSNLKVVHMKLNQICLLMSTCHSTVEYFW